MFTSFPLRFRTFRVLSILAPVLFLLTAGALAQSGAPGDLADEIKRLQDEIKTKDARIRQLEAEIARLRGRPASTQPEAAPVITVDESVPSASPRALLNALKTSYAEAMNELEMGENAQDRARSVYLKRVQAWQEKANREFRSPMTWIVAVENLESRDGRYFARALAVDPQSHAPLGAPFTLSLSRMHGTRLEMLMNQEKAEFFELKGVLVPQVAVNSDRTRAGTFDSPPFIGPFAEYNFQVDVQALVKAPEMTAESAGNSTEKP